MQTAIRKSTMLVIFILSSVLLLHLLLASNAVVGVEALSRLASKVTLGNKIVQQLDGGDQVVVDLALLAPAIDNELHGIQTNELKEHLAKQKGERVSLMNDR